MLYTPGSLLAKFEPLWSLCRDWTGPELPVLTAGGLPWLESQLGFAGHYLVDLPTSHHAELTLKQLTKVPQGTLGGFAKELPEWSLC